jgi:hypothetical protein
MVCFPAFDIAHSLTDHDKVQYHLPIWTWLFDSAFSPIGNVPVSEVKGFTNAATSK